MPENTANALLQDSRGRLWVGTQAGVAIFDGAGFTNYGTTSQDNHKLSNNMIEGLYEDQNGNIFISTRNGLNLYSPEIGHISILKLDTTHAYGNNYYKNYFVEDSEFVWFISQRNNYKFIKKTKSVQKVISFTDNAIGAIIGFDKGLLIAKANEIFRYNNGNLKLIAKYSSTILSLEKIDNQIWVGTLDGLFDENGKMIFSQLNGIPVL